jgi:hypothetical protein
VDVGALPVSLTAGDFDEDGNQDVVVANVGSFSLSVLFGNGNGTFRDTGANNGATTFQSGEGGDGAHGRGGHGGFIGLDPRNRPVEQTEPNMFISSGGVVSIVTGDGGDGLRSGGSGGSVRSVSVTAPVAAMIQAGSGGDATEGPGGNGGSIGEVNPEFDIIVTLASTDSEGTFLTGAGGDGSTRGGRGGNITDVLASFPDGDLVFTLGDGGSGRQGGHGGYMQDSQIIAQIILSPLISFELTTTIQTGSGGDGTQHGAAGGSAVAVPLEVISAAESVPVNFIVNLGDGGDGGTGNGGDGGSLRAIRLDGITGDIIVNDSVLGPHGAGGDGRNAGHGGNINNLRALNSGEVLAGTMTLRGGDGGHATSGRAGNGGTINDINGLFVGRTFHDDGTETEGLRLLSGNGGISDTGAGGHGGDVSDTTLASSSTRITYVAGDGGSGGVTGGDGGDLVSLITNAAVDLVFEAGTGGDATAVGVRHVGGDGGDVLEIRQNVNRSITIPQIAAGDGGDALGFGGIGGKGGSIRNVDSLGDIGNFNGLTYGFNKMGGLFAGAGGSGENDLAHGRNGDVVNVSAQRIASIAAGTALGPVPVNFIDGIRADVIGANTDPDDPGEFIFPLFDFLDADNDLDFTLGENPLHDPAEEPVDGIVIANVIGTIHLPPLPEPEVGDQLPLYLVEVSNPPDDGQTGIGNIDPRPV